ncbi:putative reverse transcriptase domain-containing protein [Tanacetum coccineum]
MEVWLSRFDAVFYVERIRFRIPLEVNDLVIDGDRINSRFACAISFSTIQNEGVIQATTRVVKERFYLTELLCREELGLEEDIHIFRVLELIMDIMSFSAPILSLPEGSEDFVVYCDASLKGFGAILMQREKVIA